MNEISIKATGYVEVIATQCGDFVTLSGSGIRLSTREEIEQDIDDLVRTKSHEYLEELALQMAEDIREEFSVVYAGVDEEGRAWELDTSTWKVLRELHRPDR
ncbi:MAG: hypothetical protein RLZZ200_241 [Pseudomonadota bacterium]